MCVLSRHIVFFNERKKKKEHRIGAHTWRNLVGGGMKGKRNWFKVIIFKIFFSLFSFSFSPSLFLYLYRSIRIVNDDRGEGRRKGYTFDCRGMCISRNWAQGRPISLKGWKIGGGRNFI